MNPNSYYSGYAQYQPPQPQPVQPDTIPYPAQPLSAPYPPHSNPYTSYPPPPLSSSYAAPPPSSSSYYYQPPQPQYQPAYPQYGAPPPLPPRHDQPPLPPRNYATQPFVPSAVVTATPQLHAVSIPPPLHQAAADVGVQTEDDLPEYYSASMERFRSICIQEAELSKTGKTMEAWKVFEKFLEDEKKERRERYGVREEPKSALAAALPAQVQPEAHFSVPAIPISTTVPLVVATTDTPAETTAAPVEVGSVEGTANGDSADAGEASKEPEVAESQDDNKETANESEVPAIPVSDALAAALEHANTLMSIKNSESAAVLLERANQTIELLRDTQFVSNDRWEFQKKEDKIMETLSDASTRRRQENSAKISALYARNAWDEASRSEEAFEREEKEIKLKQERECNDRWIKEFTEPVLDKLREKVNSAQLVYQTIARDESVWNTQERAQALESLHRTTQFVIDDFSNVEEEQRRRNVGVVKSAHYAKSEWEAVNALDEQFEKEEKKVKSAAGLLKHERLTHHVDVIQKMCGGMERTLQEAYDELSREAKAVLADVKEKGKLGADGAGEGKAEGGVDAKASPAEGEETSSADSVDEKDKSSPPTDSATTKPDAATANPAAIYPSSALITQLETVIKTLESLHTLIDSYKSTTNRARQSLRQSTHELHRATLDASNYESYSRVDDAYSASETDISQREMEEFSASRAALNSLTKEIITVTRAHHDREYAKRVSSTTTATGAFSVLMQQQMQTQMVSNMLNTMHMTNMSVINNIGMGSSLGSGGV
ncbi:hypothetical protein HK104_004059 [Borealophlyctis nickersoniae]|nr:hypothetical protein HK104_004059 [Borealophlyctis nickersoniae]